MTRLKTIFSNNPKIKSRVLTMRELVPTEDPTDHWHVEQIAIVLSIPEVLWRVMIVALEGNP